MQGDKLRAEVRARFGARHADYRASTTHGGGEDLARLMALVAPAKRDRAQPARATRPWRLPAPAQTLPPAT